MNKYLCVSYVMSVMLITSCASDQKIGDVLVEKYRLHKKSMESKRSGFYYKKVICGFQHNHRDSFEDENEIRGSDSKFLLTVNTRSKEVTVLIALSSNANAQRMREWKRLIEHKWSERVYIVDGNIKYNVKVTVYLIQDKDWDDPGKRDIIESSYSIIAKPSGRSSLRIWAIDNDNAPGHEVGHMLKNKDEYGFGDGVNSISCHNIMCNSSLMPEEKHYYFVLEQVKKLIGVDSLYVEMQ